MVELPQDDQAIREFLEQLPVRDRQIFLLHRVGGLKYKEIAARLGISDRRVRRKMARVIRRIFARRYG